jgi:hypothetical protein
MSINCRGSGADFTYIDFIKGSKQEVNPMKRLFPFALALMACVNIFPGCNSAANSSQGDDGSAIPGELETIQEAYYASADQRGTLVELTYNTYESRTYNQKSKKLTKRAIVYLPYEEFVALRAKNIKKSPIRRRLSGDFTLQTPKIAHKSWFFGTLCRKNPQVQQAASIPKKINSMFFI